MEAAALTQLEQVLFFFACWTASVSLRVKNPKIRNDDVFF